MLHVLLSLFFTVRRISEELKETNALIREGTLTNVIRFILDFIRFLCFILLDWIIFIYRVEKH